MICAELRPPLLLVLPIYLERFILLCLLAAIDEAPAYYLKELLLVVLYASLIMVMEGLIISWSLNYEPSVSNPISAVEVAY